MTQTRSKACFGAMALWFVISSAAAAEGQVLFNGKDLSGWRGDPAVWTVEEGAIVGRNTKENPVKHNTFLIYERPFADFELTLTYKIIGGNSGVQYRSQVIDETKFIVGGYQADFEAGKSYSGILYEERGRGILANRGQQVVIDANGRKETAQVADSNELQQQINNEDWNVYRVVAKGERLQHYINDQLTADVTDNQSGKRSASGVIAFQVHRGPPMSVYFKDIVVTPITDSAGTAANTTATSTPTPATGTSASPAPIAHWTLDDEGSKASDSVGQHHGVVHGATRVKGRIGHALLFDRAQGQHVSIDYSKAFQLHTFTVAAWVKLTKEPTFSGILGTRFGGDHTFDMKVNGAKVHGDIGDGGRWIETAVNFNADDTGTNKHGGDLALERWYHIAYVVDNEAKTCRLYLDGDLKKRIGFQGVPVLMVPGQSMHIGHSSGTEFMDGVIDDVQIWNTALTDDQVRALALAT